VFKNYFKIAFRNLIRSKVFSFINILGLAIGLACTILILLWVQDELSYDNFHKNGSNLYRVVYEWKTQPGLFANSPGMLAPEAKKVIPEIVEAARMMKRPKMVIKSVGEDQKNVSAFYEENYYLVDPSMFKMFTLPFIKGDPETALDKGMVITEEIALKYFGTTNALGRRLNVNNWFDITVTGVIKNIPGNSHFNFDLFSRLEDLKYFFPGGFTWSNAIHQTYVQLTPGADAELVADKLAKLNKDNHPRVAENLRKIYLQPVRDIYLNAGISGGTIKQGDIEYVYIFSVIAFGILLIACINFVNLSTARAAARARTMGMLKIIGANRSKLIKQILGESIFISFTAAVLSVLLVELFLPIYNNFTGKELILSFSNPLHLSGLILLVLITGLLAGLVPAIYFSRFQPLQAFRNEWITSRSGGLRRALVIVQFASSVFLIVSTLIISEQLDFIRNRKLGFNKENIVCLPVKANVGSQYPAFRSELLKNTTIKNVGIKNSLTVESINNTSPWWEGKEENSQFQSEIAEVDYDFLNTLNLKIIEGRNFSKEYSTDLSGAFIINEQAAKSMGLNKPIGKQLYAGDKKGYIIGVVNDAHFKSLRTPIQPIIFHLAGRFNDDVMDLFGVIYISVSSKNIPAAIDIIKSTWDKFNPDYPFEYYFLDETYNNLYKSEQRLGNIFSVFTSLALFVSILGLFGLASFLTEQRTKEIGIRKVLGASVINIVSILSGSFTRWLVIANVVAWPAAWYVMNNWLQSYAYHTGINITAFITAGVLTMSTTFLTVSFIAIKAATANPVESLRYE